MVISKEEVSRIVEKLGFPSVQIPDFTDSGKNREDFCRKNYPEFYNALIDFYPMVKKHMERMYLFQHGMSEPPKCPVCGGWSHLNSNHKYVRYCSRKCSNDSPETKEKTSNHYKNLTEEERNNILERRKKTNMERYGVENLMELEESKEKMKKTCIERYGSDSYLGSKEGKENFKKVCLERYGTENPQQSKEIREKSKRTLIEKYGVDSPTKSKEIVENLRQSFINKYGVDNPMKVYSIKKRQQESCIKKFGVRNAFQSEEIKEKIKKHNQEQFGCDWNCQRISSRKESGPNKKFRELLEKHNVTFEQEVPIGKYIYDFKVGNTLFEINPSITHNVDFNPFGDKPVDKEYHKDKMVFAKDNGYDLVTVWDWDNMEETIIRSLKIGYTEYDASEFEVGFLDPSCAAIFISIVNDFEIGGNGEVDNDTFETMEHYLRCKNYNCVGLVKDNEIYSLMDAQPGEPAILIEIPGIHIKGGIRKMSDFIIDNISSMNSIRIETDASKNQWKDFFENGYKVTGMEEPSYNLYSMSNGKVYSETKMNEITDNITEDAEAELILREFDKLDCGGMDDKDISKTWTEIKNVIEDSEELNKIVNERLSELYSRLGKDKFVKVYDCGRISLEFQSK